MKLIKIINAKNRKIIIIQCNEININILNHYKDDKNKQNKSKITSKTINNSVINKNEKGDNIKIYLDELFNQILNMSNIDKDELNRLLNEIKRISFNMIDKNDKLIEKSDRILDENDKLIEKYDRIHDENDKLIEKYDRIHDENKIYDEKLKKLQEKYDRLVSKYDEDIEKLNDRIDVLEDDIGDLKEALGGIQIRDQTKNFLKFFKRYLNQDDINKIKEDNSKKGDIILSGFENKFGKCKNQKLFSLIKNIIINSSSFLNEGNKSAHSLNLDYYKEEISEYQQKYNLKYILSPPIFCYCINLQLSDEDFKDSFLFLQNYFDRNLKIINGK